MLERFFLPIALLFSAASLFEPSWFVWGRPLIPYLLGLIMFGMGLTLQVKDFVEVWQRRRLVALGVMAQFTVMPLVALVASYLFGLEGALLAGMVIVGACPGGTASNVIVYLARGNVALSVTMTLASTVLAPILTPLIIYWAAGESVTVSLWAMMKSVFWIVVFPIVDGLVVRRFLGSKTEPLLSVFPSVSILAISFVIAIIVGLNQQAILVFPLAVMAAVVLHNLGGLALGYGLGRLSGCSEVDARTLAIEVGMQNSGLGVSLASSFFTAGAALPGALFSLWHNLSGIGLASLWNRDTEVEDEPVLGGESPVGS
jgi:BASS family bile acid:Na+ symporter